MAPMGHTTELTIQPPVRNPSSSKACSPDLSKSLPVRSVPANPQTFDQPGRGDEKGTGLTASDIAAIPSASGTSRTHRLAPFRRDEAEKPTVQM